MDIRPVLYVGGILLVSLAAAMLLPALVDAASGHSDWRVFSGSAAVTLFAGMSLILTNRAGERQRLRLREAFLLTAAAWLLVTTFAALPFAFSDLDLSYTDAFFEAMSGVTTTGSTVIVGLDAAPPGILLWRALLQWLGGIGIIVTAIAVLPLLQVGGMQLFRTESTDRSEKALPRLTQLTAGIGGIYLGLTAIWSVALWLAGMTPFEAVAHAMSTLATGGYSTADASIGHFGSAAIDVIVLLGMVVGGVPFVLYLHALHGRGRMLLADAQVRGFLSLLAVATLVMAMAHIVINDAGPLTALRHAAFNTVSVMTGTGFASTDYGTWGPFANVGFFVLMFIGGCAGSTACGIKIFRVQILAAACWAQIQRLIRPRSVAVTYYAGQPVPLSVLESVASFLILYLFCFAVLATILCLFDLDLLTALSGAATAISNVGPGLGAIIGPAGSFAALPDGAKWVLAAGMLLGRLELFTILVLFMPSFWRD